MVLQSTYQNGPNWQNRLEQLTTLIVSLLMWKSRQPVMPMWPSVSRFKNVVYCTKTHTHQNTCTIKLEHMSFVHVHIHLCTSTNVCTCRSVGSNRYFRTHTTYKTRMNIANCCLLLKGCLQKSVHVLPITCMTVAGVTSISPRCSE